jgi:predicted RNase H-like nuclease (RuvC/YqgF family)
MMSIQDNIARLKSLRSLMSGEPWAVKTVQQLTEQIQDLEQELTNPRKKVLGCLPTDLPL